MIGDGAALLAAEAQRGAHIGPPTADAGRKRLQINLAVTVAPGAPRGQPVAVVNKIAEGAQDNRLQIGVHDWKVTRLGGRGEERRKCTCHSLFAICKGALAREGHQDTRQLSHAVMKAKGFGDDNELRKAVAYRIVQALRMQAKRGKIGDAGKRGNARIWRLAD